VGVMKIFSVVAVLVILTSTAAFGHGDSGAFALAAMAQISDKDRSDREDVAALNQQAKDFSNGGQYEQAMAVVDKELEIAKQSDYPGTVGAVGASLCNLAAYYYKQAQYTQAEPLYRSAQKLYEDKLGPDNPAVAVVLNNQASVQERQGHLPQAESLYKRALEINEKSLGENHPSVSVGLKNLAGLYRFIHRDADAIKLEQRAVAIDAFNSASQEQIRQTLMSH